MLGDHQQLRGLVQCDALRRHNLIDKSMFERLIEGKLPSVQLGYQCRMREEFVETFRHLYPHLKSNVEVNDYFFIFEMSLLLLYSQLVKKNKPPRCIGSSMFFWTHSQPEEGGSSSRSKKNKVEVIEILRVMDALLHEQFDPRSITILTTYLEQACTTVVRLHIQPLISNSLYLFIVARDAKKSCPSLPE